MDQHSPNRSETETLAAHSAAAVRTLRDRAQRVLDERQTRLAEVEQRISAQLELVTEELSRDTINVPPAVSNAELDALDDLRSELERERGEWASLRQQQAAELATAEQQIAKGSRDLSAGSAALDTRAVELDARAADLDIRADSVSQQQAGLAVERDETEQQVQKLERERAELETAIVHFKREQESTAQADHEELNHLERELEYERASWQTERQKLEASLCETTAQNAELRRELEDAERRHADLQQSVKTEVTAVSNELAAQAATWQCDRTKLTAERDELADELQSARSQLERSLEQEASAKAGLLEVAQKLELAMEDGRQMRGRLSELEQELAARPESDQAELPELIHLREERDSLAEQVAMLEARPANDQNSDADQQRTDLQRRFEMAVEDVRELKTEKAKLEQQLMAARRTPLAAAELGATDWETQKRRLLASLDGSEPTTPERRQERVSIEGTICITDEIVAGKDREIEILRQQLDQASAATIPDRIVDADELIRAERERLVALEAELYEKLRAAEMELSIARAKLTRQESELEKQRHELEALKKSGPGPAFDGTTEQLPPKRRWLDKLGLGGGEEG